MELLPNFGVTDVGVFSLCPPARLVGLWVEYSGSLAGTVSDDQIEGDSIGLALMACKSIKHRCLGCPKRGVVVPHKYIVGGPWASPTFGLVHIVEVDMYEDMDIDTNMVWVDIGVEAYMMVCLALTKQYFRPIYSALFFEMTQLLSSASLGQVSRVALSADHEDQPFC